MAIPPPPGPPRPPPPPAMGGLKLGGGKNNQISSSPDVRSALLQSIQKGTKLKKAVTVDKSTPASVGKVVDGNDTNSSSSSSSSSSKRISSYRSSSSSSHPIVNGGPKLAGLFEGMTSMPKLKPVNSRDNVPSSRNTKTAVNSIAQEIKDSKTICVNNISSSNNKSSNINNSSTNNINNNINNSTNNYNNNHNNKDNSNNTSSSSSNNNNGTLDFNTELTKHLAQTLKRQKQQQQPHTAANVTEANLRTNRGPPPKPPIQKNMSSSTSDSVLEKSSTNNITSSSSTTTAGVTAPGGSNSSGKASSPTLSEGSNSSNISNKSLTKKNTNLSLTIGNSNLNSGSNNFNKTTTPTPTLTTPHSTTTKTTIATIVKTSQTPSSSLLSQNIQNVVPNKSRLFGTLNNNNNNNNNLSNNTNVFINNSNNSSSSNNIQNNSQNNHHHHHNHHNSSSSTSSLNSLSSSLANVINQTSTSASSSSSNKPVINYGKPNCAPKPPGIQQLISNGGKPTVTRHQSMKSPRSPQITTAIGGGSVFSAAQHFGTLRGPPQQFNQSQESIASSTSTTTMRQAPNPPIGRPTEAPPKPPSIKPAPPPVPARSVSNANLTNLPLTTAAITSSLSPSGGNSATNLNTTAFGSTNNVNNVTALKEQLKNQISYTGSVSNVSGMKSLSNLNSTTSSPLGTNLSVAIGNSGGGGGSTGKLNSPIHLNSSSSNISSHHLNYLQKGSNLNGLSPPVPSHRTQPAPDPPQRQILSNASLIPPKPPERHSSVRSNSANTTATSNLEKIGYHHSQSNISNTSTGNSCDFGVGGSGSIGVSGGGGGGIVNRLVVDIELKFGSKFHNVTEFPVPPPFLNLPKSYPSQQKKNGT